jgi:hypothetical protein
MSNEHERSTRWWGTITNPLGTTGCWQVGAMTMWIQRLDNEWRVAYEIDESRESSAVSVEHPAAERDLLAMNHVSRFGVSSDDERITLNPMLADRAVVASPEQPFYLPGGQSATVYVGTPMWLQLSAGEPPLLLSDTSIVRPSDTWFGPNTYVGELCYASRTACRMRLDLLPELAHRAFTAVQIKNRSSSSLLIERLKLPVIYLPLFCSKRGTFWTRDVVFECAEGEPLIPMGYGDETPAHAPDAERISPARLAPEGNLVNRMFTLLFHRG